MEIFQIVHIFGITIVCLVALVPVLFILFLGWPLALALGAAILLSTVGDDPLLSVPCAILGVVGQGVWLLRTFED